MQKLVAQQKLSWGSFAKKTKKMNNFVNFLFTLSNKNDRI